MIDSVNSVVLLIGGIIAIIAAVGGWWIKRGRPAIRQTEAMSEAILGRAEVRDRSGAVIQPAQAGMPAKVAELTDAVKELVQMQHRVDEVEVSISALAGRVTVLEDARVERVVTKVESAHMWRAVADANEKETP